MLNDGDVPDHGVCFVFEGKLCRGAGGRLEYRVSGGRIQQHLDTIYNIQQLDTITSFFILKENNMVILLFMLIL